jgi:hypothetical protein
MSKTDAPHSVFRAAPVVDYQILLARTPAEAPPGYEVRQFEGLWLAHDPKLPLIAVKDVAGRPAGHILGFASSNWFGGFATSQEVNVPVEVASLDDIELRVLPKLSGMFVYLTGGQLPARLYMDHGGSLPIVCSPQDKAAACSAAMLLDEDAYRARFRADLHKALIGREGAGGWISGTLTAHSGVFRVLPNHVLDLETWTSRRFWPRRGDFAAWRDIEPAAAAAADALSDFCSAAARTFDVGVTLTAGFDSRLLMASCRRDVDRFGFFTLEAPNGEMDVEVSQAIAHRFGLSHRVLPLRQASEAEMAGWDRMVGDCMVEAPRRTHTTLRDLTDRNAVFTGMYGEVGRCRLYRQDLEVINAARIDAQFVIDRLTLPPHPELLENIGEWFAALEGQPNSVILDLAFHELKFGSWAMGQRPISNSIKLNFLPFAQRPVLEAFLSVAPVQKTTEGLFLALIGRLWPELMALPVNKYGDVRDYLGLWKKLTNPTRVRRFLRDRLAKRSAARA